MNIAFLLYDIHFVGGVERVTVNMANDLVRKGNRVTIVSLSRFKPQNIFTLDNRVDIIYLNFHFENGFNLPQKIASVFSVSRHIRKYSDQTIILGIGTFPSLILALLPKRKNLKTVGCQHNSYAFAKHIWAFLRKLLFHRLNALVSLTEQDLPKLKKLNPNSFVIPNSVSFFPEKPAQLENKIILAIGRMDHNKGYDLLLDAFERLSLSYPDWKLQMIGDGPLKEKIIARVKVSGIKDRIEIISPTKQILDYYLEASIYLMTSRKEGLPMVLLEAQACGLPIVSFDCETGPSDIINNDKDGYLIECFDVESMTEKMAILCSDYKIREEFGTNGRENIKRFFPEVIALKWETLFQKIIQ